MISVVMPAHNEEGYIGPAVEAVVSALRARGVAFEVVVAENGSSDRTAQELDLLRHTYAELSSIHLVRADYGRALRAGFEKAQGEIVVNFDVDLVDLDFLDRALGHLDDPRVDVVLGSKRAPGSTDHRSAGRRAVTTCFSALLRWGFGLEVSDTHGVKALRRASIAPLVEACRFGQDVFDTELILRAERSGLRLVEIPISVEERRPPRTPIARRIPRSLAKLAQLRLALWREGGAGRPRG